MPTLLPFAWIDGDFELFSRNTISVYFQRLDYSLRGFRRIDCGAESEHAGNEKGGEPDQVKVAWPLSLVKPKRQALFGGILGSPKPVLDGCAKTDGGIFFDFQQGINRAQQ